jgi:hypothetical protein
LNYFDKYNAIRKAFESEREYWEVGIKELRFEVSRERH